MDHGGGHDSDIQLRDLTADDLRSALHLSRAVSWNQTEDDWRILLSLGPGLFRLAVVDGRVVGSGGAVRYANDLAWICMILVDPACRGHGVGTLIFEDVLKRVDALCRNRELRMVGLDATPAGRGIYARHGFRDGPSLVRLRAEPNRPVLSPPDLAAVRPIESADLSAVLAQDRRVFGADRGSVLSHMLRTAPEYAWQVENQGRIEGYCLGRHGDHADQLGPLVASTLAVAQNLLEAGLSRPGLRPVILDAFAHTDWLSVLAAAGFVEQRPFTRMYRGDLESSAPVERTFAVLGPEFG